MIANLCNLHKKKTKVISFIENNNKMITGNAKQKGE